MISCLVQLLTHCWKVDWIYAKRTLHNRPPRLKSRKKSMGNTCCDGIKATSLSYLNRHLYRPSPTKKKILQPNCKWKEKNNQGKNLNICFTKMCLCYFDGVFWNRLGTLVLLGQNLAYLCNNIMITWQHFAKLIYSDKIWRNLHLSLDVTVDIFWEGHNLQTFLTLLSNSK